ncbi:UTRA domain-containing protein [Pseudolactococcus plantarum]|uniref:UTRA domain-containing protein n=1 Tax=Pseudolactococcus plantarum TaxID=1365 RepID=UPI0009ED4816|nr:UTRA domain-containing protein [Lactococcus sp.]
MKYNGSFLDDSRIGFSDKYISINKTNSEISSFLNVEKGSPVLIMEEIYYTNNGEPFYFTKNFYHYKHAQFFLQS